MEQRTDGTLRAGLAETFASGSLLRKLGLDRAEADRVLVGADWEGLTAPLTPIRGRLTCKQVLAVFRPVLDALADEPAEGWLRYAYQVGVKLLYPAADRDHTSRQWDAALCFLQFLQVLFDAERQSVPFDPWLDFDFCTEAELADSAAAGEYHQFLARFRGEYLYETLRLGREVTPFHTLEHIAGVHHVAMTVARAFKAGGGLIDLAVTSGAAAGHDIGKFGCKPGERVPYLHYHYTDQWFAQRGLTALGRIAANHSVWDLELENLSAESLTLVYADFRVKQERDGSGGERACLYALADSFDVILSKLDNVDDAKRRRYRYVYAKLRDFEDYLVSFGVDTTLKTAGGTPAPRRDAALLDMDQVVAALRRTAVDHNLRLMHRLGRAQLFAGILEAARGEKSPTRQRAYLSVFEEYFTYWSAGQKEQTLDYLYELLLSPDGNIRRQAATLMGGVLANFASGYRKELPAGVLPDPQADRPFQLWAAYLEKFIHPDRRLTPRQTSMIRYQAKTMVDEVLGRCADSALPRFAGVLLRYYQVPQAVDPEAAFALLDTVLNVPLERLGESACRLLTDFAAWWLDCGGSPQKAAALRLFRHLAEHLPRDGAEVAVITAATEGADCVGSTPLLYLQADLGARLGLDMSAQRALVDRPEAVSNVFLDNLKTATPWVLKAVGVEYLLGQARAEDQSTALHIATHFANLIKVSENVVVRRLAGAALLELAPLLTMDRRNEMAVELCKALETGQAELAQYIPRYLGRFTLWLQPRELDEIIDHMAFLLSSVGSGVMATALSTVGSMLEHYAPYGERFGESADVLAARRDHLAGLLLKGLASNRETVRQESLRILGEELFASPEMRFGDKADLFTRIAKKLLFLITEQPERELTFFYTAAALSHIYHFLIAHQIEVGPFRFRVPEKAAFFPGTFDPFSLSHKGIVRSIRDLGFEVYLAVDEFSWSKKAQPSLVRRQIVSMSVADEFDVYLFPHDIPVNLASPEDLTRLRQVFNGRPLYLAVGSDVVANASSYKAAPVEGSVHSLNHIVFRRSSDADGREIDPDLTCITGDVLRLQLPTHLESISSTHIRENIDLGRDISHLIDPAAQDYIYREGLYLREPQYKQLVRAGDLAFQWMDELSPGLWAELGEEMPRRPDPRDSVCLLRRGGEDPRALGLVTTRTVNSAGLYGALGSERAANAVRERTAGRVQLLTGLYGSHTGADTVGQLLLTEVLSRAMEQDCGYAVWYGPAAPDVLDLLERQGFRAIEAAGGTPLLLVDMRSPAVLLQNIPTTLKEPFASDRRVQEAIRTAGQRFQRAVTELYPGSLVLSLNAEVLYHRLVQKITARNGVPTEPTVPRTLGKRMCVPFGKVLRGNVVPNTVTKTLHTDKVFAPDLRSYEIRAFPGCAPLESQVRTLRSFQRPVILVDDLLHSGTRVNALDPLLRREGVEIDEVLVGLLSGRGRDLMAAKGWEADSVYYVPNLRTWFVESTMYPFIGGDTVGQTAPSVPGLTPAVNLILPYAFPRFYRDCSREAVFRFSRTCIENSRSLLLALESAYRERYTRNLTLSRLSEAVILPLSPDKGDSLRYDPNLPASACLENDLRMLERIQGSAP